jgi:hypothetical protein
MDMILGSVLICFIATTGKQWLFREQPSLRSEKGAVRSAYQPATKRLDLPYSAHVSESNLPANLNGQSSPHMIAAHQHDRYCVDLSLSRGVDLRDFVVCRGVMRPEVMSSIVLARYLSDRTDLFSRKTVIDMGSGTGIQGIVMARSGASHVIFSDISPAAVANTRENSRRFGIEHKSDILEGDLFAQFPEERAEVIVFNHPFFPDDPVKEIPISISMLDSGSLIHRFLEQAKTHLNGVILMPYFALAGPNNDPGIQGPEHGYSLTVQGPVHVSEGLQRGDFFIYELRA